jgi:hypothetical protein
MTTEFQPQWWSWADIVKHADQLGIPNFQRGAVWDTSNRAALLESLYEQSPCGSFVLWAPDSDERDQRRHGVPLRAFANDKKPMWLVDGQQRTRAMLDTYQQMLATPTRASGWSLVREADIAKLSGIGSNLRGVVEDDADEGVDQEAEDDVYPWMAVLPTMSVFERGREPYFGRHSESRNVRRGSIFRRLRPHARTRFNQDGILRPVPPLPVGTIPLAALVSPVGVFHDDDLRARAHEALLGFDTEVPDLKTLDELLPWGPQFVTGHAYDGPAEKGASPPPLVWAHLYERRKEGGPQELIGMLAGLFTLDWALAIGRFRGMLEGNRFAVGWLPRSDVSDAIDAYVRINRAGIRVRAEERALALLSRARPDLLDDLADFSRKRDDSGPVENQRALLAHESDRQMGFGLWMTTVTRYTTLALLGDSGRRWLGVSAIDKDTFSYRLDRVGPNETDAGGRTWSRRNYSTPGDVVEECAHRATPALLLIDSVLSQELCFDHRMARPSTRALFPLIDLFYRVPGTHLERLKSETSFRDAVARLLHWTLLAPYIDQPDLEQLVVDIHGFDEAKAQEGSAPVLPWDRTVLECESELKGAFARYQAGLLRLWTRKHNSAAERQGRRPLELEGLPETAALTRLAINAFASEIRDARSLQHPAVGWLYALERRGRAREFLWAAQIEGYRNSRGKVGVPEPAEGTTPEAELQRWQGGDADNLYPEKQHIVPFAIARHIVGKGGTRSTASPSNAIGNLTWLSRRQNGLGALSDRWAVMDRERDSENLAARGMFAVLNDGTKRDALNVYESLCNIVLDGTWRDNQEAARHLLNTLCDARQTWMEAKMSAWLNEPLTKAAHAWLVP